MSIFTLLNITEYNLLLCFMLDYSKPVDDIQWQTNIFYLLEGFENRVKYYVGILYIIIIVAPFPSATRFFYWNVRRHSRQRDKHE